MKWALAASIDDTTANVIPSAERFPFPIGHLDRAPARPVVPYVMFVDQATDKQGPHLETNPAGK
jgi:hypothetical protein